MVLGPHSCAQPCLSFWGQKEILLHVLQYIQYLQRNIDVAKALLKFHTTNGEGGLGGK